MLTGSMGTRGEGAHLEGSTFGVGGRAVPNRPCDHGQAQSLKVQCCGL